MTPERLEYIQEYLRRPVMWSESESIIEELVDAIATSRKRAIEECLAVVSEPLEFERKALLYGQGIRDDAAMLILKAVHKRMRLLITEPERT